MKLLKKHKDAAVEFILSREPGTVNAIVIDSLHHEAMDKHITEELSDIQRIESNLDNLDLTISYATDSRTYLVEDIEILSSSDSTLDFEEKESESDSE